ncbi:hypothetical protein [Halosolutus halophilus]|uniref:hypothetical protein n=1 Tax=Halosolutus halophilus TaxID=1552990 RepID=UPI002234FDCB|nr:hypothetical protein [Halosolutus halophilus]
MQRRTLLGLAASAGIVGVLGATVGIDDEPSAPPATYADEPVPRAWEWNRPVVATDTTTAGSDMYGTVRQHASVLDLEPTGRYALVTRYRLIPGSNYHAGSGWKTISLTVEHAWRSGSLVSHPGDVVPADDGDADSNLYLGTNRSTGRYRWHLTFDAATGNSRTFCFATVVDRDEAPEAGDALVDATFGAGFTKGFLRTSERDIATARLVMRGTSE